MCIARMRPEQPSILGLDVRPMLGEEDRATRLDMAHVLFMDLVGYSRLSLEEQSRRIGTLQEIVRSLPAYRSAEANGALLSHPAGDGMALAFFGDPSSPAQCALEAAEATRSQTDLPLRMGIHSGPVHRAEDINRTANVRGPGINVAQRVMDCGDAGDILLSYTNAEVLMELDAWSGRLRDFGELHVKHGLRLRLYGLATGEVGSHELPSRLRQERAVGRYEHANHNIPAELTSFVGRDDQIREVVDLLPSTRLLTLMGTGGTGKTRMAMRVGTRVLDKYADGV